MKLKFLLLMIIFICNSLSWGARDSNLKRELSQSRIQTKVFPIPVKNTQNKVLVQSEKLGQKGYRSFIKQIVRKPELSLEYIYLKFQKDLTLSTRPRFEGMTSTVFYFVNKVKKTQSHLLNEKTRKELQLQFFGLSQMILKSSDFDIVVQNDYYDKLHDVLISQSINLFYSSYKDRYPSDLFFTSYYLSLLKFPMDLVAHHIQSLQKHQNYYKNYLNNISTVALLSGQKINQTSVSQLDLLLANSELIEKSDAEKQKIEKSYLKHIQLTGDQEKVKEVKRTLAAHILKSETLKLIKKPTNFFKYLQYCVGYIFIAWPLEVIVIIFSLTIFLFQSSTVLSEEEKNKSTLTRRLWLMFTKAYLGSNVPFFSKLAASLVLFGIGLYFNSAKNFVESMLTQL